MGLRFVPATDGQRICRGSFVRQGRTPELCGHGCQIAAPMPKNRRECGHWRRLFEAPEATRSKAGPLPRLCRFSSSERQIVHKAGRGGQIDVGGRRELVNHFWHHAVAGHNVANVGHVSGNRLDAIVWNADDDGNIVLTTVVKHISRVRNALGCAEIVEQR